MVGTLAMSLRKFLFSKDLDATGTWGHQIEGGGKKKENFWWRRERNCEIVREEGARK